MIKLAVLIFTMNGEIVVEHGPIPQAFCDKLAEGIVETIITEAPDASDWTLECKPYVE